MRLIALVVALVLSGSAAAADFSASSIAVSPAEPDAGDVVRYEVVLRNGGEAIPYVWIDLDLASGVILGLDGDCSDAWLDEDAAIIDWTAGKVLHCTITALTFAHAAGANARLALDLRTPDAFWRVDAAPQLDTPTPPPQLIPTGVMVVLFLALVVGLLWATWFAPPRRRRRVAPVVAMAIASLFFLSFADLAWRDWRAARDFVETDCTILATLGNTEVVTSSTRRRSSEVTTPLLALRYVVEGQAFYSTGLRGPSHLLIGGGGVASPDDYPIGSVTRCRYDPTYPATVLVHWGPGLAYLFALLPLLLFAGGALTLSRMKSR